MTHKIHEVIERLHGDGSISYEVSCEGKIDKYSPWGTYAEFDAIFESKKKAIRLAEKLNREELTNTIVSSRKVYPNNWSKE